ncbi:uncharacterized protein N7479_006312, partial [Penicillium vulpinum]|uniref:uncharacterized protein n=1 Tax=Penicillium vulpinum TaxID=29845 RepID=UPI0025483AC4
LCDYSRDFIVIFPFYSPFPLRAIPSTALSPSHSFGIYYPVLCCPSCIFIFRLAQYYLYCWSNFSFLSLGTVSSPYVPILVPLSDIIGCNKRRYRAKSKDCTYKAPIYRGRPIYKPLDTRGLTETIHYRTALDSYTSLTVFVNRPYRVSKSVDYYEYVLVITTDFGIVGIISYLKKLLYGYNTYTLYIRRLYLNGPEVPLLSDRSLQLTQSTDSNKETITIGVYTFTKRRNTEIQPIVINEKEQLDETISAKQARDVEDCGNSLITIIRSDGPIASFKSLLLNCHLYTLPRVNLTSSLTIYIYFENHINDLKESENNGIPLNRQQRAIPTIARDSIL